jgi:soluble lytic murein transglycosylase-like protein
MMWRSFLWLSLGTLLTGTVDVAQARQVSRELSSATASEVNRQKPGSSSHRKSLGELRKMIRLVGTLGGKPEHARILLGAGGEFGIDPVLLASLAFVESSFRERVSSKCGALGLMQVKPLVMKVLGVTNPWDPHQNIMAGAAYLRHCFERYRKEPNSTFLALAAYNIGPGPVRKLTRSNAAKRFVKKVLRVYNRFTEVPIPIDTGASRVVKKRRSLREARAAH